MKTQDEIHEAKIRKCLVRYLAGKAKWSELVALIKARSPQQVRRMEEEKGLL